MFLSYEVVLVAVMCCQDMTSFFRVFFSRHLMKPPLFGA